MISLRLAAVDAAWSMRSSEANVHVPRACACARAYAVSTCRTNHRAARAPLRIAPPLGRAHAPQADHRRSQTEPALGIGRVHASSMCTSATAEENEPRHKPPRDRGRTSQECVMMTTRFWGGPPSSVCSCCVWALAETTVGISGAMMPCCTHAMRGICADTVPLHRRVRSQRHSD